MHNWKLLQIKDVCQFIGGSQPPKSQFSFVPKEGYVRLIQTRDFKTDSFATYIPKQSTKKFFTRTDIMIGRYGPPVFQIFRGLEGAYNVALLKAKPLKNIDNDFLYYFLLQQHIFQYVDQLSARTGGQTGVDLDSLYEYPIRLPDLATQKKIASVLTTLDKKIDLNNRINAELETMAKTLYDYWFVQFDFPDANGKPYKASGGEMEYNTELKRMVPKGWEVKKLGTVAHIKAGGDKPLVFSVERTGDCSVPIFSNGIVNDGLYGFTDKPLIHDPSITISARGTIGYCVLRSTPFVPIIRLIVVTPKIKGVIKYFDFYLKGVSFQYSGSVQNQLTVPQVSAIDILYPSEQILRQFSDIMLPVIDKINKLKHQNEELASFRNWLLPMLMNGQVTVGEAKEQVDDLLQQGAIDVPAYTAYKQTLAQPEAVG